ncbi:MAG: cell division topological specificity factor MinE [Thermostichus sp. BF3_bins_97]
MVSFFERIFGRSRGTSSTAKDRLQLLLIHDRINLPPERLQAMKEEILAVISKYVPVDVDSVDIALEQRDRFKSKIVAEFPFASHARIAEIDENSDFGSYQSNTAEETDDPQPKE